MSFANRVIIVTGASSGIGAAIAVKFAEDGAQVVLVARNQEKLKNVAEKCAKYDKKPLIVNADMTNEDDVKRIVNETVQKFGKIDVLVNNAGAGTTVMSIEDPKVLEAFDNLISLNLRSVLQLTNLAVPYLIKSKGNIINISSVAGLRVFPSTGFIYGCSKAALDYCAKAIAVELAAKGVRVNNINPGPVRSDIMVNMGMTPEASEARYKFFAEATPLKRVSHPEEVADLTSFLASEKANSITGSTYVIDCGLILK